MRRLVRRQAATLRTASVPVAVAMAAAVALLLAACSGGGSGTSGAAAPGRLVVGATSDPDTLFPWKATQFQAVNVLEHLYGTLTELDEDLNVVPGLAESWEVSDDGLTVTFALRAGVTFADGSAFDSADVKASLDHIMDEATGAVARPPASRRSPPSTHPTRATVVLTPVRPGRRHPRRAWPR